MAEAVALLTPDEAAARLHVCTKTLRQFRRDGLIRYVAVTPRTIRYRPEDCDAYLASRVRIDPPAQPTLRKSRGTRRRGGDNVVVSFTARRKARLGALEA